MLDLSCGGRLLGLGTSQKGSTSLPSTGLLLSAAAAWLPGVHLEPAKVHWDGIYSTCFPSLLSSQGCFHLFQSDWTQCPLLYRRVELSLDLALALLITN